MSDGLERRVAVVGAGGFVGRALLRELEQARIPAVALVRGIPELAVESSFHEGVQLADLGARQFDVVINLAYPTSGAPYEQPEQNSAIVETVARLVARGGHVIQASTLAVFGMTLDRQVSAEPAPTVRDDAYVESKVAAEHLLTRRSKELGVRLDIVRLGNVWGYASPTWALPLVQRLVTGRPVGVQGRSGFSNVTDVANVASYLRLLVDRSYTGSRGGPSVGFHHLAEFSMVRWADWIGPLAEELKVDPVLAHPGSVQPLVSSREEIGKLVSQIAPRSVYRALAPERTMGSWTRTAVRSLPSKARVRLKNELVYAEPEQLDRVESMIVEILASRKEFVSVVDASWAPPLSKEASLDGVLTWLRRA